MLELIAELAVTAASGEPTDASQEFSMKFVNSIPLSWWNCKVDNCPVVEEGFDDAVKEGDLLNWGVEAGFLQIVIGFERP